VSNAERVDSQALEQLEAAIEQVTEELATWRRRAHKAESDRVDLSGDGDIVDARARILELEGENRDLHNRVKQTRRRVADVLTRLRFLEEQTAAGGPRR
jgi:chromosome segregation ATPase